MSDHGIEENGSAEATPSWFRMKAVFVHLYTASGAVLALLMLVAASQGEVVKAPWLMFLSLLIDSTDGLLARRFRVSEALPFFDGALLDNIVDYMTYVFAPIVLLWSAGYLPDGNAGSRRAPPRAPGARAGAPGPAGPPPSSSPRCRCWRRATSSAGSTPRPTTTSSSASLATSTWSRSPPSCSSRGRGRWRRCSWSAPSSSSCRYATSTRRAPWSSGGSRSPSPRSGWGATPPSSGRCPTRTP